MIHIGEYDTCIDRGKYSLLPVIYKKICVHLVYDINNYEHHNSRLVDDENLTDIPV